MAKICAKEHINMNSESSKSDDFEKLAQAETQNVELNIISVTDKYFHPIKMLLASFFKSKTYQDFLFEMADTIS